MANAVANANTFTNAFDLRANKVALANENLSATVSIVTITQYNRKDCLRNLAYLIKKQLYQNIVEWVIVEGSRTEAEAFKNATIIRDLGFKSVIPIKYVPFQIDQHLSDRRNAGNAVALGEIIVCMDDDDYYPPTRVSHAVYTLTNAKNGALIAGCSRAYIYFYLTGQFFQFKSFGAGHSTNNCLAYKRAYLETHQHMAGLDKAEESSFMEGFTVPMAQLDPAKTIVISGHGANTVDKSLISLEMMIDQHAAVLDYMPLPILLKMEKIFETLS
jgi:glycosyltransferase involved in cell wall biosynthesis